MRLILLLGALCVLLFSASLFVGSGSVSFGDSLLAYLGEGDPLVVLVMQELRLPRALLAVLIGASLGLAGAGMQGFLRNPLAEPGIVGTSAFAALGAVLSLQTGLAAAFPMALPLAALAGSLLSVFLLVALAGPGARATTLVLSGVALSAAAGAMVTVRAALAHATGSVAGALSFQIAPLSLTRFHVGPQGQWSVAEVNWQP